ncbi:MAG: hypothetical protein M1820_005020 [Bogoriella megaspora]|nr:MAG: hypothetical protein M1820_005020 [Bogoriella megaspora]
MTTVSRPSRPDPRPIAPPRTASIDSQMSSISSNASHSMQSNASHSYNSSQDTTASTPPDVSGMIAAAGSAENLILKLIKDKQAASSRDTQLWRLVEKQRAMILGLNKDLDRALKEKEKYRKRLKEHLAASGRPLSNTGGVSKRDTTPSSVFSDGSLATLSSNQSRDTISGLQIQQTGSPMSSPSQNPELKPAPLSLEHASRVADSKRTDLTDSPSSITAKEEVQVHNVAGATRALQQQTSSNELREGTTQTYLHGSKQVREDSYTTGQDRISIPPREYHNGPPTVALTKATPILGAPPSPAERPSPVDRTTKKGPPAPLDLSQHNRISNHLHQISNDNKENESDSEYDDILEVNELPIFEDRGRRKTREEDDQQRDAIVAAEEIARSQSTKLQKKNSKTGSQSAKSPDSASEPSDGKVASPIPKYNAIQPNPESIAALLSPSGSEVSQSVRSNIASPLTSPGLPTSPRPGDRPMNSPTPRLPQKAITSPPTSPRPSANTMPLSPRAPKQPIPMPPNSPLSSASPHLARAEQYQKQAEQQSLAERLRPVTPQQSPPLDKPSMDFNDTPGEQIFKGFMSSDYPGHLITPPALSAVDIRVYSSRLKPSRASFIAPKPEEDPVFTLAVYARSDGRQLWRVEKTIAALPPFDLQMKSCSSFRENLPDRALFNGHAPAKIDARRSALNAYFNRLMETSFNDQAALTVCKFLSTDVIGVENDDRSPALEPTIGSLPTTTADGKPRKDGYLTKRGKNFGGWKARYFVLDGPQLRYFEAPGGAHLGSIKLPGAQIGKQSSQQASQSPSSHDEDVDNQYRHAFLILEPKKRDSSSLVRHVLCAESDEERDAWVDALLQYVDYKMDDDPRSRVRESHKISKGPKSPSLPKEHHHERPSSSRHNRQTSQGRPSEETRGFHYEDAVPADAPRMVGAKATPSPPLQSESPDPATAAAPRESHPMISGPTNGVKIDNAEAWGNKAANLQQPKDREPKKRSIFGFRQRASSDFATIAQSTHGHGHSHHPSAEHKQSQLRAVFGAPLSEAVFYFPAEGIDAELPAVVFRCIEYLTERSASSEEGIFRLSGSNVVIKALRDRFNAEGDVKLLEGQYYDIHAVASLLKLYLRELPSSILTRELHLDFLRALDFDEKEKKIAACNVLVYKLPSVNFDLLKALSAFLLTIINNADINKMSIRNVGIVFAPTLNIPAPLISLFLTDFDKIFGAPMDEAQSPIKELTIEPPSPDSIRSPRHQMFSDLPTPGYNTTAFPQPLNLHHTTDSHEPHHQPHHQRDNSFADTGFIPIQPSYTNAAQTAASEAAYSSLNSALAATARPSSSRNSSLGPPPPAFQEKSAARKNRRESSMLGAGIGVNMGMGGVGGNRKGSEGMGITFFHE